MKRNPLTIRDPLLEYSTKGREWAVDDLLDAVKPLAHGRSFDVGQHVFKMAACIACHRVNKEGNEFGPDLTKLDPKKRNPEHILRSLIEPSKEIDKKYQMFQIELNNGKFVTGMIVKETPKQITVLPPDYWIKKKPILLDPADVASRIMAPKSIMPEGIVNRLSREEILDLIAFVYAGGDRKHMLFQGHKHKK